MRRRRLGNVLTGLKRVFVYTCMVCLPVFTLGYAGYAFEKWNGSGWGGNPQPVISYTGDPQYYGIGEPSFVLKDGKLYVYYSYVDKNRWISGTPSGHLDTSRDNFIAYAYQPPGKGWGDWPTHLDPIGLKLIER